MRIDGMLQPVGVAATASGLASLGGQRTDPTHCLSPAVPFAVADPKSPSTADAGLTADDAETNVASISPLCLISCYGGSDVPQAAATVEIRLLGHTSSYAATMLWGPRSDVVDGRVVEGYPSKRGEVFENWVPEWEALDSAAWDGGSSSLSPSASLSTPPFALCGALLMPLAHVDQDPISGCPAGAAMEERRADPFLPRLFSADAPLLVPSLTASLAPPPAESKMRCAHTELHILRQVCDEAGCLLVEPSPGAEVFGTAWDSPSAPIQHLISHV